MFNFLLVSRSPDKESVDLTADSDDICEWEVQNRRNSLTSLNENTRMTDLRVIAYLAARRTGVFTGEFADFKATYSISMRENVKSLDRAELIEVISLALLDGNDPEPIADRVMDLLESLQTRTPGPTRPGHSPG